MSLDQFEAVVKTQFYSQFEIFAIKRGQWMRLEDLLTGKTYTVYEKKGSETLPGRGVLPGRIAQFEQKWYLVGANSVYFPMTYTERAKRNMKKFKIKNFSPKDTIELLMDQEKHPQDPIPIPDKKELEEKRKSLKEEYESAAKKCKVTFSFDDLVMEIYNEKKTNVLDFWKAFGKRGLKFEVVVENIQLLQDIWNYFPHKCLKNLSPIEVFAKFNKKGSK